MEDVLFPVMCVLDGTWAADPELGDQAALPEEWTDFALMQGMSWSWEQLQTAPLHVRRYCVDFLNLQHQSRA